MKDHSVFCLDVHIDHGCNGADLHGLMGIGLVATPLQARVLSVLACGAKGTHMLGKALYFKLVLKMCGRTGLRDRGRVGNIMAAVRQAEFAQLHIHRTGGY